MRVVVQRVAEASVTIEGRRVAAIGRGLLVLAGFRRGEDGGDFDWMAAKLAGLRIFRDAEEKMNLSVQEIGGAILLVPQFTLHGDARKGRRPSFIAAAAPEAASPLFDRFASVLAAQGIEVALGVFGADMQVALVNDGPVTLVIEGPAEAEILPRAE